VICTRDVKIRVQDGVDLIANAFRHAVDRSCPVVMSGANVHGMHKGEGPAGLALATAVPIATTADTLLAISS
jgi:hypothetical protein